MNKKVLFLSPLPPPAGGISSWTKIIVEKGLPNHFQVIVVNTRIIGKRLVFERTPISATELYRVSKIILTLIIQLVKDKPNIVHLNSSLSLLGISREIICAIIIRFWRIPIVSQYHGNVFEFLKRNKSSINYIFLFFLCRLSQTNIALNKESLKHISKMAGQKKCTLMPNFIDDDLFKYKAMHTNISVRVLFVGAITCSKGCLEFIEVAKLMPSISFYLLGTPHKDMDSALKSLPENVVLLGAMSHLNVIKELCASDIFFFPSTSEGFPNAVLEAMAVGLPVVATPVGAIPEMVEEGKGGFLSEQTDISSFIESIHTLEDPELRTRMGRYNREKCRSKYAYSIVSTQLTNLYERSS